MENKQNFISKKHFLMLQLLFILIFFGLVMIALTIKDFYPKLFHTKDSTAKYEKKISARPIKCKKVPSIPEKSTTPSIALKQKPCIGNASRQPSLGNRCVCDYGFAGDAYTYCDECGMYHENHMNLNNHRTAGQEFPKAVDEYRWPSAALIIIATQDNQTVSHCDGVIIDRQTVMTGN